MVFWPDGGTFVVGDIADHYLRTFRVEADGTLKYPERYYRLRTTDDHPFGTTSLVVDATGRLYAATAEGVQVFDTTGRLSGVMLNPGRERPGSLAFGGKDLDLL